MYNRYIPVQSQYGPTGEERNESENSRAKTQSEQGQTDQKRSAAVQPGGIFGKILKSTVGGLGEEAGQTVKSLLKAFHLENLDAGDILLALIVLFLILEDGDNLDLIITLGLMILFTLGEP